ncbi:MAG: M23 family metallopeptidase [Candidatus Sigynarchaeota archaeon]
MDPSKKKAIIFLLLVGGGLLGYALAIGVPPTFDEPVMEFPIKQDQYIYEFEPYGVMGWDGPNTYHSGIDIKNNATVDVVAPVKGTVVAIFEMNNMYSTDNNINFNIIIQYNWHWMVILTLEPHFPGTDTVNNSLQRSSIYVTLLQRVNPGDVVAKLYWAHSLNHYSHLHFTVTTRFQDACPRQLSSPAARLIYDRIAAQANCSTCLYVDRSKIYFQTPILTMNLPLYIAGVALLVIIVVVISRKRRATKTKVVSKRDGA